MPREDVPDDALRAALAGARQAQSSATADAASARAKVVRLDGLADYEQSRAALAVMDELPPYPLDDVVAQHEWLVAAQERALTAAGAAEGGAAWKLEKIVGAVERLARTRQEQAARTWASAEVERARAERRAAAMENRWCAAAVELGFEDVDQLRDSYDDLAHAERAVAHLRAETAAARAEVERARRRRALACGAGGMCGVAVAWSQREAGLPAALLIGGISAAATGAAVWALSDLLLDNGDDLRRGAALLSPVRGLLS